MKGFKSIWKFLAGRWIYEKVGLSHFSINLRWGWCVVLQATFFVTLIAAAAEALGYQSGTWEAPILILTFAQNCQTLLTSMREEYSSKYTDLLKVRDSIPEIAASYAAEAGAVLFHFPSEALNFVSLAIEWDLARDTSMSSTFNNIIARIDHVRAHHPGFYTAIEKRYSTIGSFIERNSGRHLHLQVEAEDAIDLIFDKWKARVTPVEQPRKTKFGQ